MNAMNKSIEINAQSMAIYAQFRCNSCTIYGNFQSIITLVPFSR